VLRELPCGKEKLFSHPRLLQVLQQDGNEFEAYA
jgi:hypothetical protein